MRKKALVSIPLLLALLVASCSEQKSQSQTSSANGAHQPRPHGVPTITFVELGSVNCIPCRAMQPVMQSEEFRKNDLHRLEFEGNALGQHLRTGGAPQQSVGAGV